LLQASSRNVSIDGAHGGGAEQFVTLSIKSRQIRALPTAQGGKQGAEIDLADLIAGHG
jgi:hypothetical protein